MMLPQRQPGESREAWMRRAWFFREQAMQMWRDQAAARAHTLTTVEAWTSLGWEHPDAIRAHALGVKL